MVVKPAVTKRTFKASAVVYEEFWSKYLSSIGVAVQEQLRKNEVDKAQLGNQLSK